MLTSFNCTQLSTAGGRLIISSDGVWDALSAEAALDCCRGMPAEASAAQIVKVDLEMKFLVIFELCNFFFFFFGVEVIYALIQTHASQNVMHFDVVQPLWYCEFFST